MIKKVFTHLKNLHPLWTVALLSLILGLVIFKGKHRDIQYGDSGLMSLQVKDILHYNYSDLSFHYIGEDIDSDHNFLPYTKPFLGKVKDKYYIDFPPYFPLINSYFYEKWQEEGLYIIPFISSILTFFIIYKIGVLFNLSRFFIHISLLSYTFGTTILVYNFLFHEYPLGVFFITLGIYNLLIYLFQAEKWYYAIFSGLFTSISLYFRLEFAFVILSALIGILFIMDKNKLKSVYLLFIVSFSIPFITLLYLNYQIHGHILGLRYYLTLVDKSVPQDSRLTIIFDTLFSTTRGLFYQSSFLVLSFILFSKWKVEEFKKEKYLLIVFIISLILILLASPNHGDHKSPRYLFGIYPIAIILSVSVLNMKKDKIYQTILLILFTLSLSFSIKNSNSNYEWMKSASKNIFLINNQIMSFYEDIIVFREYDLPLNIQSIYNHKKLFVANTDESFENFSKLLNNKKVKEFIVSKISFDTDEKLIKSLMKDKEKLKENLIKLKVIPENYASFKIDEVILHKQIIFVRLRTN